MMMAWLVGHSLLWTVAVTAAAAVAVAMAEKHLISAVYIMTLFSNYDAGAAWSWQWSFTSIMPLFVHTRIYERLS